MIVTIEGNIGSGKSTLVQELRNALTPTWTFLDEPVEEWLKLKDESGRSLIELFYSDKKRYSYTFQNYAYITRMRKLMEINNADVNVTERCVLTDKNVFAQMLTDDGYMNVLWKTTCTTTGLTFSINSPRLIWSSTSKRHQKRAKERIKKRAREGEDIPLEYLDRLHEYHEKWMTTIDPANLLVLDGETDFNENSAAFVEKVKEFVNANIVPKKKPLDNTSVLYNFPV